MTVEILFHFFYFPCWWSNFCQEIICQMVTSFMMLTMWCLTADIWLLFKNLSLRLGTEMLQKFRDAHVVFNHFVWIKVIGRSHIWSIFLNIIVTPSAKGTSCILNNLILITPGCGYYFYHPQVWSKFQRGWRAFPKSPNQWVEEIELEPRNLGSIVWAFNCADSLVDNLLHRIPYVFLKK